MGPILTLLAIYSGIILGSVLLILTLLAGSEGWMKIKAIFGSRRGKGLVQMIKGNGMVDYQIVDFSKKNFEYKDMSYDLETAKKNPGQYLMIKWILVPVALYREGNPTPLPLLPNTNASFDMDYFNTVVKKAYMTGAMDKREKLLKRMNTMIMLILAGTAITAAAVVIFAPYLMPIHEGLRRASSLGVLEKFTAQFIAWLKKG